MKSIPFYIVAGIMLIAGCGNHAAVAVHDDADHDEHEEHAEHKHGHAAGVVEFSAERAASAGLETEKVTPGAFGAVIRTSGEILPAQGDEAVVVATTSGTVSLGGRAFGNAASILPGTKIAKGQILAVISAREMADGDPIAKSRAAYEAARKEFERAGELLKSNAVSRKVYEQAEKEYAQAKAEYDAINGKASDKGLSVTSPLTGYVKQLFVSEGEYVAAGQPIAEVTMNRRLQLRADLPEKYWAEAGRMTGANFKPSYSDTAYNVKELGGRMVAAGRTSADGSFYIPVIFEFNNAGNFIPGAFCEIYLIEGQRENIISVPESALVEEQGVYSVYVKVCSDEYRKQEVKTGESDGIRREIVSGLKDGDEVVTRGAYQVKLASVSGTIPGHTHNH